MPEKRLNSDVLPAPFGPMIPRSSPFATSRLTSTTIFAPPMSSPRLLVARIGGFIPSEPLDSYLNGVTGGWTLPGETIFVTLAAK